jgi:hypothetical protein
MMDNAQKHNNCFQIYNDIKYKPLHINYQTLHAVVNAFLQYCNIFIS